jgi:hypothetical protein
MVFTFSLKVKRKNKAKKDRQLKEKAVQTATAGLTQPGQFGAATGLAGASGYGSLGTAGQAANLGQAATNVGMGGLGYGALGAGYGALGAQQGQQAAGYGAGGRCALRGRYRKSRRARREPA